MADIRLVKPQPNTTQTVSCAADSRFVFEFPSDTALFAKDGNDLVLTFEDGSSLRLQNFYTTYSKEEMPTFEMEGTEISGEDFFAALGDPDLMPAAGPSASAQGNSSFNVYDSAALMNGIDRLDGLDIGFAWGQQPQEDLYASIGRGDDEDDAEVTPVPEKPTIEGGTENGTFTVTTDEGNLVDGSRTEVEGVTDSHGAIASGHLTVNLDHAEGTITIGDSLSITVNKDGNVTAVSRDGESVDPTELYGQEVPGEHGSLSGFEVEAGADGNITISYDYTLTSPVDGTGLQGNTPAEGTAGRGETMQADKFDVTVTTQGGTASGSIVASALDDVPVLDSITITNQDAISDNAESISGKLEGLNLGADSEGATITVVVNNTTFIGTRDEDGKWNFTKGEDGSRFELNADNSFTYTRPTVDLGGTSDSYTFDVTVTDGDGDTVSKTSATVTTAFVSPTIDGKTEGGTSTVTTDEGNIESMGSGSETDVTELHDETASGTLSVNLDHAEGTITIGSLSITVDKEGNVTAVSRDGESVDASELYGQEVPGEHGSLSGFEVEAGADGNITISYDYTLTSPVDGTGLQGNTPAEGTAGRGETMQADKFDVTVTTQGGTASGTIIANALDDAPVEIKNQTTIKSTESGETSEQTFSLDFGYQAPFNENFHTTENGGKHLASWEPTFDSKIEEHKSNSFHIKDHTHDDYAYISISYTQQNGNTITISSQIIECVTADNKPINQIRNPAPEKQDNQSYQDFLNSIDHIEVCDNVNYSHGIAYIATVAGSGKGDHIESGLAVYSGNGDDGSDGETGRRHHTSCSRPCCR